MSAHANEWVTRFLPQRQAQVDVADDQHFTGYPIVFNSLSENLGGFRERIMPAAVDRTIRKGTNVDALLDHKRETTSILGSTDSGLLRFTKDRHGLKVRITPPDTTHARDALTVVRAGLVKGMSFAFRPTDPGGMRLADEDSEDGLPIIEIHDMEFSEVSIVVNPAYLQTEISARNAVADQRMLEAVLAETKWRPSHEMYRLRLRALGLPAA